MHCDWKGIAELVTLWNTGYLQLCAGQRSGCGAAVHLRSIFDEEDCHAILLVDVDDVFNRLNRKVFTQNIGVVCPSDMTINALGSLPVLRELIRNDAKQVAYAGELEGLLEWWSSVLLLGPKSATVQRQPRMKRHM